MSRRLTVKLLFSFAALFAGLVSRADDSNINFGPYSMFGIGDLNSLGTAYTRSMGGVGIAMRNKRFINLNNPASITARDTLSFMADFSAYSDNRVFSSNGSSSANNSCYINDLALSFPLWKNGAMKVALVPFSSAGYSFTRFETDPYLIGQVGNVTYSNYGNGSIYQVQIGIAHTFFKRLSVGIEYLNYFGNIGKWDEQTFANSTYQGYSGGYNLELGSNSFKVGVQYDQPLSTKSTLCFGATYRMASNISGYVWNEATSEVDTLSYHSAPPRIASEIGTGLAFRYNDQLMVEFDFLFSDWSGSNFQSNPGFSGRSYSNTIISSRSLEMRLGLEYVPNRNDVRYYMKKCSYRLGAYYKKEPYIVNGHDVDAMGITAGISFPVFRWHNALSIGLDFGKRGGIYSGQIQENYFNFTIGLNIFDIWFQQPKYE